jgi:hypothetical protein
LFVTDDDEEDSGSIASWSLIFKLAPPPRLDVQCRADRINLRWHTNAAGYRLQSTVNPTPPAAWANVTNQPVLSGVHWAVTNNLPFGAQFFRLTKP